MIRKLGSAGAIAVVLLFTAYFLFLYADSGSDSRATGEQRLRTWTKATAVVSPDGTDSTHQTLVTVRKLDGSTAQTYLAGTDTHPAGEQLTVYFDPAKGFPFKSPHANQEVVAQSQLDAAVAPKATIAVLAYVGAAICGIGAIAFGIRAALQRYRKVSAGISTINATGIGAPSAEQSKMLEATVSHDGNPRQLEVIFFAAPPREIGQLLSAESTDLRGGPRIVIQNLIAGVLLSAMTVVGFWWGSTVGNKSGDDRNIRLLGFALGLIVLACTVYPIFRARIRAACTYVGERGIAKFDVKKPWGKLALRQLQFEQATSLRTAYVRQRWNGVYVGTEYRFTWSKPDGSPAFYLEGKYKDSKPLPDGDQLRFLKAAETAWSSWVLTQVQADLAKTGVIQFPIDDRLSVQVGKGVLHFLTKGEVETVSASDIASIDLTEGQFLIKHKDAKWYSRAGKYSFRYSEMPNAKVFLLSLEKLLGVKI